MLPLEPLGEGPFHPQAPGRAGRAVPDFSVPPFSSLMRRTLALGFGPLKSRRVSPQDPS